MKTIIIDLPPNLSPNGIGLALRAIADDILTGAVVPVPPFHYCVDTAVGTVTFWDVDNEERIAPADNQAHPPLNTPLSAFTPAMLDALPVGSEFGPGDASFGAVTKTPEGWWVADGEFITPTLGDYDSTRPLIRVGPEQASEPAPALKCSCTPEEAAKTPCSECGESEPAPTTHTTGRLLRDFTIDELRALPAGSRFGPTDDGEYFTKGRDGVWRVRMTSLAEEGEDAMLNMWGTDEPPLAFVAPGEPAPLPDPWPGMIVEVQADSADEWDRGAIRRAYRARHGAMYVHVEGLENPVQWHPDEIREVRTPDGTTLWKRPAAKVTTEPRPLSTYTEEERRAFPVGTKIGIYTKHADAFPPVGEVWRAADGLTLMGGYVADAMARSGDMLVHFPAKVTT